MGYMGLGMQRWIFTQKTRKLFQKRSKPDSGGSYRNYDTVEEILKSTAKYRKFVDHKSLTPEYKELLLQQINADKKLMRQRFIIITLLTILFFIPVAYFFFDLNKPKDQSKVRTVTKEFFTPAGKVNTIIFIDESTNKIISIEQHLNDSLIYKEDTDIK